MNRPWLKHYDPKVPRSLHYPDIPLYGFLVEQAQAHPNRLALICEQKQMTYTDLVMQSQQFANKFIQMGLKKGDRVAICLPNTIDFVTVYFGVLVAGGVVAAMNPNYPLPEWMYQAELVNPKILVGQKSREDDLFSLQKKSQIEKLIFIEEEVSSDNGRLLFSSVNNQLPKVQGDWDAVVQFSGGTTGTPKAALALHRNVVANVLQFRKWLSTMQDGQEVFMTIIPLYHVYGMVIGLNVPIAMGATIVLVPDARDLGQTLDLAQEHEVTCLPGVPSLYHAINKNPKVLAGKINLRTIKACISGSAPLPQQTREKFETLTGGKLVEGYGLSEAPTATHCNPIQGESRLGSIGLPLPDVDCRIVDLKDDNKVLDAEHEGELLIRSPQVMKQYLGAPEETAAALKDGWLHTGDIAKMDSEGYFYLVGRKKELIKVHGLQVWPLEVEKVLQKYPGVKEVGVAGVPDDNSGEAVKAWLVIDDADGFDESHLREYCKGSLAGYKIPKAFEIVPNLPKSPIGKLLRRELQRLDNAK